MYVISFFILSSNNFLPFLIKGNHFHGGDQAGKEDDLVFDLTLPPPKKKPRLATDPPNRSNPVPVYLQIPKEAEDYSSNDEEWVHEEEEWEKKTESQEGENIFDDFDEGVNRGYESLNNNERKLVEDIWASIVEGNDEEDKENVNEDGTAVGEDEGEGEEDAAIVFSDFEIADEEEEEGKEGDNRKEVITKKTTIEVVEISDDDDDEPEYIEVMTHTETGADFEEENDNRNRCKIFTRVPGKSCRRTCVIFSLPLLNFYLTKFFFLGHSMNNQNEEGYIYTYMQPKTLLFLISY